MLATVIWTIQVIVGINQFANYIRQNTDPIGVYTLASQLNWPFGTPPATLTLA